MRLKPKFRPNLAPVPRAPRARKVSGSVAAAGDAAAAARRIRYGHIYNSIFVFSNLKLYRVTMVV